MTEEVMLEIVKGVVTLGTTVITAFGAYFGTKYLNRSTISNYEDDELFSEYYKDASKTLKKLSLAEKIGQLFYILKIDIRMNQ